MSDSHTVVPLNVAAGHAELHGQKDGTYKPMSAESGSSAPAPMHRLYGLAAKLRYSREGMPEKTPSEMDSSKFELMSKRVSEGSDPKVPLGSDVRRLYHKDSVPSCKNPAKDPTSITEIAFPAKLRLVTDDSPANDRVEMDAMVFMANETNCSDVNRENTASGISAIALLVRSKYVNSGRLHEAMPEIFVSELCVTLSDARWIRPAKGLPARDIISFRSRIRLVTAERPVKAPFSMDVMPVSDKSSVALPVYPAQLVRVVPVQLQPAGRS